MNTVIDYLTWLLRWPLCRLFDCHGLTCRGFEDHDPNSGRWTTRW